MNSLVIAKNDGNFSGSLQMESSLKTTQAKVLFCHFIPKLAIEKDQEKENKTFENFMALKTFSIKSKLNFATLLDIRYCENKVGENNQNSKLCFYG